MKTKILSSVLLLGLLFLINGCEGKVDNSLTIKNLAAGAVYVNFRGQLISVPAGSTTSITEIPKGTYTYNTTYQVPSGVLGSSFQGAVSGSVTINAGTKILIAYSSTLFNNSYILYATVSSNDEVTNP